jgi:hypothetical protein
LAQNKKVGLRPSYGDDKDCLSFAFNFVSQYIWVLPQNKELVLDQVRELRIASVSHNFVLHYVNLGKKLVLDQVRGVTRIALVSYKFVGPE